MSPHDVDLARVARQLLAIEELLGGEYLPAVRHPLPKPAAAPAATRAGAAARASGDDRSPGDTRPRTAGSAAPATAHLPPVPDTLSPAEKAAALAELDATLVKACTRCGLHRTRNSTVFGEGNPNADLVFVGEAPGADEDRTGRPFVGRAGELLTKMILAMGLTREDVFIVNTVKCRPPDNRTPAPEEDAACRSYLLRQLEILRPRVIVTLGNPATKALLETREGITRLRGTWQSLPPIGPGLEGIPVMPTFHPAYLLRQYTPDNRRKVWSDLQQVMDFLGLQSPKP